MVSDDPIWDGIYPDFDAASGDRDAFESEIWLGKLTSRQTPQRPIDSAGPSVVSREYLLPVIAATFDTLDRPLRILDFGGGLAATFPSVVGALSPNRKLDYVVVENEAVCDAGRERFPEEKRLRFVSDIPAGEEFDIVHAGSSLHYVEDWSEALRGFASTRARLLVFVDLPAADNRTFVTTQFFHGQRIPVWFWNLNDFVTEVGRLGYELVFQARFNARYWEERPLPTEHFPNEHRLEFFVQLVFRQITHRR